MRNISYVIILLSLFGNCQTVLLTCKTVSENNKSCIYKGFFAKEHQSFATEKLRSSHTIVENYFYFFNQSFQYPNKKHLATRVEIINKNQSSYYFASNLIKKSISKVRNKDQLDLKVFM